LAAYVLGNFFEKDAENENMFSNVKSSSGIAVFHATDLNKDMDSCRTQASSACAKSTVAGPFAHAAI